MSHNSRNDSTKTNPSFHWVSRLRHTSPRRRRANTLLTLERMEDRTLLSTLWVTNTGDSGPGSLRQAILDVNADTSNPAADTIDFAILGTGVQVIQPLTDLPTVTHPVSIDGYSQPGSSPNTLAADDNAVLLIELDGSLDTSSSPTPYTFQSTGLSVSYPASQGGSTVQGLDVTRFGLGIEDNVGVCAIQGNFIGTDPTGTVALGNGEGVFTRGLVGTNGDGVNDYAERNVVSGNSVVGIDASYSHAVVAGNFIGTDITGTKPVGNGFASAPAGAGVHATNGARVGADGRDVDPTAERNIISGNAFDGVVVDSGVWIAGNYIGTDVSGTKPLGNGAAAPRGVGVLAFTDCRIGTNDDGVGDAFERNVISSNIGYSFGVENGIALVGSGNVVAGNYIGTDPTGQSSPGVQDPGVAISGSNNRVGGDGHDPFPADERNVISGNGSGVSISGSSNVVAGNYIGTDPTGENAVPNTYGIFFNSGSDNRIGTDSDGVGDAAERNVIPGNRQSGIRLQGGQINFNTIAGNYIGTDATGTQGLGNGFEGGVLGQITFYGASGVGNLIGVNPNAAVPADGRNLISGGGAVEIDSGDTTGQSLTGTVIAGNYLGVDVTGEHALGGGDITVGNSLSTRIGTSGSGVNDAAERNVIQTLVVYGTAAGTLVAGNYIGTDASGTVSFPNNYAHGVVLEHAVGVQIGGAGDLGNTIAFSTPTNVPGNYDLLDPGAGVTVLGGSGDSIRGNSIHDNADLGIDLGGDGVTPNTLNGATNFPVLSAAYAGASTSVAGTLNSAPNTTFTLDFYANAAADPSGFGQGQRWLGSATVTTDGSGIANFGVGGLAASVPGEWISATATGPSGTSEFGHDVQAIPLPLSSLSGVVFSDFNDDGQVDFGEQGIAGVPITLTGTDDLGHAVSLSQTTDADGTYVFLNLRPGTYTITETQQPAGYTPGIATVGTGGGTVSGAQFTGISLTAGENALNYNYGERPAACGAVHSGLTAGIGFWNNTKGQALIKALNGGVGTQLGQWLALTFPHIFGASSGSNDLAGQNNAYVASFFQSRFVVHGQKLDAQVLATALAVYVTDPTLGNTGVGAQYGFIVSGNGLATATYNVGTNGAAFGVADNTVMTVMNLLLAADAQAVNGVLYNGDTVKRNKANTVFSAINEAGSI
jgi:hypothetical protein